MTSQVQEMVKKKEVVQYEELVTEIRKGFPKAKTHREILRVVHLMV